MTEKTEKTFEDIVVKALVRHLFPKVKAALQELHRKRRMTMSEEPKDINQERLTLDGRLQEVELRLQTAIWHGPRLAGACFAHLVAQTGAFQVGQPKLNESREAQLGQPRRKFAHRPPLRCHAAVKVES